MLATNLGLLEPGLEPEKQEFHLVNTNGADGYIDIYARDRQRNHVIIEVKLRESATRSGPGEVLNYANLLRNGKSRVPKEYIRIIFASATWHSLLTPVTVPC
jgi:RecB family endonuclease NucS